MALPKRALCCLASAFLIAACSSSRNGTASSASSQPSSGGSSAAAPSSSAPAPSSSAPAQASPPTKAQLEQIVLQQSDLPQGWTGAPHDSSDDTNSAAVQAELMKCVGAGRNTEADTVADVDSDDFTSDNAQISSSATSYKSQADIAADVALLHNPKISTCFLKALKTELATSLPHGAKIESATFKIKSGSGGGPKNVVARGSGTLGIALEGQRATAYIDISFITGRLLEAEVDAENIGTPVPASILDNAVAAVADRAAKA